MLINKLVTFIIVFLCSFQMAFADTVTSYVMAQPTLDANQILEELKAKKSLLRGDIQNKMNKAEMNYFMDMFKSQNEQNSEGEAGKTEFFTYIESLKKSACYSSSFNEQEKAPKKDKRGPSIFTSLTNEISKIELEDEVEAKTLTELNALLKRAYPTFHHAKRLKVMIENHANSSNLDYEIKKDLILAYNDSIIKGLHDIKVILKPFISTAYLDLNSLMLRVSDSVIEEDTELHNTLLNGEMKDKIFFDVTYDDGFAQLSLNEFKISKRDIVTINESPSAKNYLYALRILTIQMMASQVKNYNVMLGDEKSDVIIPYSCRSRENGSWPARVNLQVKEGISDTYLDNLITNIGLTYDESNLELMSVKEAEEINPISDSIVASTSVENYFRAVKGKDEKNYSSQLFRPGFNEYTAFDKFIQSKMGEIQQIYYKKVAYSKKGKRGRSYKHGTSKDLSLINDLVTSVSENKTIKVNIFEDGEKYEEVVYPFSLNASPYLASKLAEAKTDNIEDIIDDEIKRKLRSNKIRVQFPSLYSQEAFRNWGLNYLQEKLREVQGTNEFKVKSKYHNGLAVMCHARSRAGLCSKYRRGTDFVSHLISYIDSLKIDGKFIPVSRLEGNSIKSDYILLSRVFNYLRDYTDKMPELHTNEYDYLIEQMNVLNPIAKVKLGFLIARKELEDIKNGQVFKRKKTARGMRVSSSERCFNSNMTGFIERLDEASKALYMNRTIAPGHLSRVISKDDHTRLWKNIYDEFNKESGQVLSATIKNDKKTYSMLEKLSSKVTLDSNAVERVAGSELGIDLSNEALSEIDERSNQEDVEKVSFYKEIMRAKNHQERMEIFDNRPEGIDLLDDYDLVHNFMKLDFEMKKPVYKDLLKRSIKVRRNETFNKMSDFCNIEENDLDSLKENFYSTVKIQDELNQLIGIPAVPKELMDRMGDWSDDEQWALFNGVFGFLLGMGAVLAAGSCTVLTGGLCGLAIAGAGTIGFGMQANAIRLETLVKFRADSSEEYVEDMAELGFTDSNATENVARGWIAVAFEVIGTISMISILTRSVSVGTKIFKESLKSLVKNKSKLGIKKSLKLAGKDASVIVNESEVEFAKLVLGLKKYKDVFKNLVSSQSIDDVVKGINNLDLDEEFVEATMKKLEKIKVNHQAGKLSEESYALLIKDIIGSVEKQIMTKNGGIYRYTSDVVVDLSYREVDHALAKTVTKLFNNSPLELRHYMSSYIKRLNPSFLSKHSKAAKAKLRYAKAKDGKYVRGTNWLVKAWNENTYNLAKNRHKFLSVFDELQRLPVGEMEQFIVKNADVLTDIFVKIPLRKRDFPFLLIQGAPHTGGFFGRRLPVISAMGEGILVRKIFTARARLVSEVARKQAREALGLKKVLMAETMGDLYKGLEVSVRESMATYSSKEFKEADELLANVKSTIIDSAYESLKSNKSLRRHINSTDPSFLAQESFSKASVEKVLYQAQGTNEEVLSRFIWSSVDAKLLFQAPEVENLAYKVLRDNLNVENVGGLQKYLNALKVLKVKDSGALGNVELF